MPSPQTTPLGLPAPLPLSPSSDPHDPEASSAKAHPALGSSRQSERERCWPQDLARGRDNLQAAGLRVRRCRQQVGQLGLPFLCWTGGRLGGGSRSPSSAVLAKVLRGSFMGLPWTPQTLPGRKLEPILPYLPALTSFEDGTKEPWEGAHLPVTLTSSIKVI